MVDSDQRAGSCVPKAMPLDPSGCDVAALEPKLGNLGDELIQPSVIFWHGMVSQPATYHTRQPSPRCTDTIVSAAEKFHFDRCQCSNESLATGTAQENKSMHPIS